MNYELLSALALGLLVAINPCQLAINISAITYIVKNNIGVASSSYRSMMYVLGRSVSYTLLAWILLCLIGGGKNVSGVQYLLSKGEDVLPYVLIVMGVFMLYRGIRHHEHEHGDDCHNSGKLIQRNGPLGSLILGMTLALAFCPESAVFYFGVMLPMSATSDIGPLLPVVFSIGAAIPVILLAYALQKAADKLVRVTHILEHLQRWLNIIAGVVFILLAAFVWIG